MARRRIHRKCVSYPVCKDLRALLKKFGVPRDTVQTNCAPEEEWPCHFLVDNARLLYESILPENSEEALEFISKLFLKQEHLIDENFKRTASEPPFYCPELELDVYQPCKVSSCSFHTHNPWTLNCILFYRLRQGRDALNLNELSFLLSQDVSVLRSQLNKSFRQLSQGALKETIDRETREERITRLNPQHVCVVCERRIENKRKLVKKSGFHYCSQECANLKPPPIIKLEQEFKLPIDKILHLCVEKFSNVKYMCSALGVSASAFEAWCQKHQVKIPSAKQR